MRTRSDSRRALAVTVAVAGLALCVPGGMDGPAQTRAQAGGGTLYLPLAVDGQVLRGLPPVSASHGRGFADDPFDLVLDAGFPGASIRFTRDGTVPRADRGEAYVGPIRIDQTTILRAAAFKDGHRPSPITTLSYLFLRDVVAQPALPAGYPATWGVYPEGRQAGEPVPADYAVDPRIAFEDPRYAPTIVDDLLSIPSLSIAMDPEDLFGTAPGTLGIYSHPLEHGSSVDPLSGRLERPWERPASAEWLRPDGESGFQIDAGIRIAGGWSRKPDGMAKHSFSLRFRGEYGAGRLRYPLFGADDPGPTSFDALRLRAGQADTLHYYAANAQYVNDEWGRVTQGDMGSATARGTWAHLYLNGLYWGVYNVTEELDDAFAADHLGGEEDQWDVIEADPTVLPEGWRADEGSAEAFETLLALKASTPGGAIDRDTFAIARSLLDLDHYMDYTLIQIYGDNWDWPHNNWTALRSRVLGGGFRFFVWDYEQVLPLRRHGDVCGPCSDHPSVETCGTIRCGGTAATSGAAGLHGWLLGSPEYRLAFADRARRHLFEDGALTPHRAAQRYARIAGEVERALVGESARWGDVDFGQRTRGENWFFIRPFLAERRPWTLDDHWRPARNRVLAEFFPGRTAALVQQLCDAGLFPPVSAPRIRTAESGATSRSGHVVTIDTLAEGCAGQTSEGVLYYTLDGQDPREAWSDGGLWHGAVRSPGARPYRGPFGVPADRLTRIVARLRTPDGLWSAAAEATLGAPRLAVSELMYNPPDDQAHEWLEILNLEPFEVDLGGVELRDGVTYTFAAGSRIDAGGRLVLARDASALVQRHPLVRVHDEYAGGLSGSGERITVQAANGAVIWSAEYADDDFWPLMPDGLGYSLVLRDPWRPPSGPESWRASARPGGSPGGADEAPPFDGRAVINEVLAGTDPPFEDAVEIHNPSADGPVDVGGWYLSDDRDAPRKFRIPDGTLIPPGGFAAFYAADFQDPAGGGEGFAFSADGEEVTLFSADAGGAPTGHFTRARFEASRTNISFGRLVTAAGIDLTALVTPTFGVTAPESVEAFRSGTGAPNAAPLVGPVVVNEIMDRPDAGRSPFVELLNVSGDVVALGGDDASGTGAWAVLGSIELAFPAGVMLEPGALLVLSAIEPEAFRARHGVPDDVRVIGPWDGALGTEGARITLAAPRDGESASLADGPWVVVERIRFSHGPPWPAAPSERGVSLERVEPSAYGNAPGNWIALRRDGSPGRPNTRPARVWLPLLTRHR